VSDGIKLGLLDLINGGGIGAAGDKFEGGGLLSVIANAIATPYGSEDRMRNAMREQRPMARQTGGLGNGSIASTDPASPQLSPLEMFGGQQPAEYSRPVQGSGMTPANNYVAPPQPPAPSYTQPYSMYPPQPKALSPDNPLSFESFTDFIIKNYDQSMARRMLSNSDQYDQAYDLFVRNGGRL
jgi:hypothetical protein